MDSHAALAPPHKLVTHSGNRKNKFRRLLVLLNFLAQAEHVSIHRPSKHLSVVTPNGPQEFVPWNRGSGPLDQIAQQLKLSRSEIDRLAISSNLPLTDVHAY